MSKTVLFQKTVRDVLLIKQHKCTLLEMLFCKLCHNSSWPISIYYKAWGIN